MDRKPDKGKAVKAYDVEQTTASASYDSVTFDVDLGSADFAADSRRESFVFDDANRVQEYAPDQALGGTNGDDTAEFTQGERVGSFVFPEEERREALLARPAPNLDSDSSASTGSMPSFGYGVALPPPLGRGPGGVPRAVPTVADLTGSQGASSGLLSSQISAEAPSAHSGRRADASARAMPTGTGSGGSQTSSSRSTPSLETGFALPPPLARSAGSDGARPSGGAATAGRTSLDSAGSSSAFDPLGSQSDPNGSLRNLGAGFALPPPLARSSVARRPLSTVEDVEDAGTLDDEEEDGLGPDTDANGDGSLGLGERQDEDPNGSLGALGAGFALPPPLARGGGNVAPRGTPGGVDSSGSQGGGGSSLGDSSHAAGSGGSHPTWGSGQSDGREGHGSDVQGRGRQRAPVPSAAATGTGSVGPPRAALDSTSSQDDSGRSMPSLAGYALPPPGAAPGAVAGGRATGAGAGAAGASSSQGHSSQGHTSLATSSSQGFGASLGSRGGDSSVSTMPSLEAAGIPPPSHPGQGGDPAGRFARARKGATEVSRLQGQGYALPPPPGRGPARDKAVVVGASSSSQGAASAQGASPASDRVGGMGAGYALPPPPGRGPGERSSGRGEPPERLPGSPSKDKKKKVGGEGEGEFGAGYALPPPLGGGNARAPRAGTIASSYDIGSEDLASLPGDEDEGSDAGTVSTMDEHHIPSLDKVIDRMNRSKSQQREQPQQEQGRPSSGKGSRASSASSAGVSSQRRPPSGPGPVSEQAPLGRGGRSTAVVPEDMRTMMALPPPRGLGAVEAYVVRDRSQSSRFPRYALFIKVPGASETRAAVAQRMPTSALGSAYVIAADPHGLSLDDPRALAVLRSNLAGTSFTMLCPTKPESSLAAPGPLNPSSLEPVLESNGSEDTGRGFSPYTYDDSYDHSSGNAYGNGDYDGDGAGSEGKRALMRRRPKGKRARRPHRRVMGSVAFRPTWDTLRGTWRLMAAVLPDLSIPDNATRRWDRIENIGDMLALLSRPPVMQAAKGRRRQFCYMWDDPRVAFGSSKNFQLCLPDEDQTVVVSLGKMDKDKFALSYSFPITGLQAFALVLASMDRKLCYMI